MAEVLTSKGPVAIIDDRFADAVSKYKWSTHSRGYAVRRSKGQMVYLHRMVIELHLGRELDDGEEIHHLDEDKLNCTIENLVIFPNHSAHMSEHSHPLKRKYGQPNPLILCACGCGTMLTAFDSSNRPRMFVGQHYWNLPKQQRAKYRSYSKRRKAVGL